MSELTEALRTHGQQHRGTDLGGLLQWAALHAPGSPGQLALVSPLALYQSFRVNN